MTGRKERWPKADHDGGIEDAALLIMEWLAEQGIGAMLRVDAERLAEGRPSWTFAASGGPLVVGMRTDAASAALCLSLAVARLRELGVVVPY
ncbi:hypothetical protein IMZ11_08950 [Microtetraspora sp. AC03309]|uniref:hypothetical protein n=1 Tax=Microtetraspora sp. AC03309 TaxID=2779376 RepID=UPI001E6393E8|nr:hypothetical protein [Microtetraspora sp. AC03309]MCC5575766.1 hypothetical protein [Microtetraspora sp. AC03309]